METDFSRKLRRMRNSFGKTQAQIADALDVSRKTYSTYETGRRTPGRKVMLKLAEVFHVSPAELYGWDTEEMNAVEEMQKAVREYEDEQETKQSMRAIGGVIRRLREEKRLTLTEVSKEFNIDLNTLTAYENGTQEIPQHIISAFAAYYGVNIENVIALEMEALRNHTVLTTSKTLGDRYKKWQMEVGYDHFTDAEIDEMILFAKFLQYKRKNH